jgi:hypothetical protein
MSLHAQLSPQAQAALAAQKRTSTISALIISILSFGLVILILMVIALTIDTKNPPEIISYSSGVTEEEEIERPETTNQVERKPSSPSSSMAKVIASSSASPTAVPVPTMETSEVALDFGNGDDFGDGWGDGDGSGTGGGGFGNLPATMKKRCSIADRMARLLANGGNKECEEAVMKSLRWLQSTQNSDGSWTNTNKGAMTGFALLAFLGHCETPISPEFGETVEKAIVYLVNLGMGNDGRLATAAAGSHHWVYEHGIATYALAEAYTFCDSLGFKIPNLAEVTKTAGDMIIQGQTDAGGWLYSYKSGGGGDNSVGFWQIQALKACKNSKLWEDGDLKTVSRKALEWLTVAQGENGAIGYRGSPSKNPGLTGGGVLAFQMWDKSRSKEARKGVKYIRKNTDFKWGEKSSDLYYHYYNAQAMINAGGDDWKFYNDLFRDELLKQQKEDGTWKGSGHSGNLHMSTCLATFMLEVYYRFLPSSAK